MGGGGPMPPNILTGGPGPPSIVACIMKILHVSSDAELQTHIAR